MFQRDLQQTLLSSFDPTEQVLQRAMPVMSEKITALHSDLKATFSTLIEPISRNVSTLQCQISNVLSGRVPISINADFASLTTPEFNESHLIQSLDPTPVLELPSSPIVYKLSRGIQTVTDLWREWAAGLAGWPAVRDLEIRWGAKWCPGNERRFFCRRKTLIDAICNKATVMQGGATDDNCFAAATVLEQIRKQKNKSLDWLSKNIAALYNQ